MIKNAFAQAGGRAAAAKAQEKEEPELRWKGRWMMNSKHKTHSRRRRSQFIRHTQSLARSLTHSVCRSVGLSVVAPVSISTPNPNVCVAPRR